MTDKELIKAMVSKFLGWKLPAHFNPDAGISFTKKYNVGTPYERNHEPVGTNLFTADQAMEMFEFCASEAVAAWEAEKLLPMQRQVAILQAALKPAYIFYMIEVERVGWLSGKKEGQLSFTHSVEDAITFFDKHSADVILKEFFGSEVSYMHPTTYGRVSVTEHMWCNRPADDIQAIAEAYDRGHAAKVLVSFSSILEQSQAEERVESKEFEDGYDAALSYVMQELDASVKELRAQSAQKKEGEA